MKKTRESEIKRFEEIFEGKYEKIEDKCYLVNGSFEKFKQINTERLLVFLPYCLKPIDCEHRLKYSCNPSCDRCVMGSIVRFLKARNIEPNFIIYDDKDVPKGIKNHIKKFGKIDGGVCILCPEAAIENRRFIFEYDVPVLMFFIDDFEECDFKKANLGKFWGKTSFDFGLFKRIFKILEGDEN